MKCPSDTAEKTRVFAYSAGCAAKEAGKLPYCLASIVPGDEILAPQLEVRCVEDRNNFATLGLETFSLKSIKNSNQCEVINLTLTQIR